MNWWLRMCGQTSARKTAGCADCDHSCCCARAVRVSATAGPGDASTVQHHRSSWQRRIHQNLNDWVLVCRGTRVAAVPYSACVTRAFHSKGAPLVTKSICLSRLRCMPQVDDDWRYDSIRVNASNLSAALCCTCCCCCYQCSARGRRLALRQRLTQCICCCSCFVSFATGGRRLALRQPARRAAVEHRPHRQHQPLGQHGVCGARLRP